MAVAVVATVMLLVARLVFGPCSSDDAKDWPMYNHDVIGTRHNPGETALDKSTARRLEEKWRFPAKGSNQEIGVIHATPVVVNGYVYFGTATDPTFYKLTPDGKVRWSYRRPGVRGGAALGKTRFQASTEGIMGSALVTDDTVYFADTGGWIYALDRFTGAERWKRSARASEFPGAHPINVFFAGPFVARGKLIVAGGSLEQVISASPFYKGNSGRGFVAALEPKTGEVIWKYDVGPKPEPLKPPITINDSFGSHTFYFGPAHELGLEHAVVRRRDRHDLLRHRRQHRAAAADHRRPAALHPRIVRGHRDRRRQGHREVGHTDQPRRRLDQRHAVVRPQGRALQGPGGRRHAQDLHDPRGGQADQGGRASAARTAAFTS